MTVAKRLKAVRRYVALHTYEVRQGWSHFKEEAAELWQYQCFRFEHWFRQFWPFRSLAWLLSLRAPRDKGFGRFGGNEKMDALMKHVHRSDKFKFENVCKSVGDAMANADSWGPVSDGKDRGTKGTAMTIPEETKLTPEKIETFRAMGDGWLHEAQREEFSTRIRADAAFDAGYMYCRVAMAGADEKLEHPHQEVLTGAAERLGWNAEDMAIGVQYLAEWYAPLRGDDRLDGLLALALRLKEAVDADSNKSFSK